MDLQRLRPVFESAGPYVTLDLDVGRAAEDAEDRADARWTRVRHFLEDLGDLPDALVADVGERVRENTHLPGEVRRTLVVSQAGGILLDDVRPGHHTEPEVLDHAPLPDLAAWVDHHDQAYPFVLAVVDRVGADLQVHRASSAPASDQETVTGETFYITKVSEGDWAQKQFQQTAEDAWQHNARLVADEVHSLARRHGTRAVLVAGEVRARSEVVKALGDTDAQHLGPVIEVEAGGRSEGSSEEALHEEVREHLSRLVADRDATLAARLDEARGRGEGAAVDLDEVLTALAKSQVDTVLADLAVLAEFEVDPGRHEGLALPAPAVSSSALPADRVLVAAACLTGAHLAAVPATMAHGGGVSALLRWSEAPSASPEV